MMKAGKRLLALLLSISLIAGLTPVAAAADSPVPEADTTGENIDSQPGFENFERVRAYSGEFSDVPASAWYYEPVIAAYELGLVNGTGANRFSPSRDVSVAELLVLASRLLSIYMADGYEFEAESPWYQPYVDYALNKGLIQEGQFIDYSVPATRADFASIVGSLPGEMLNIINEIPDQSIPEIPFGASYKEQAYLLYRAGIFTGIDTSGAFRPQKNISRGEVSTVVARIVFPAQRKNFSLTVAFTTLYADDGSSLQVPQWACDQFLPLGWRTAPFTVPSSASTEEILNAATLIPTLTNFAELDAMVDDLFAKIFTPDMTTYDKVKACYDYLINNTVYGYNDDMPILLLFFSPYNPYTMDGSYVARAYGVLKGGVGVCDDYAATFLVLTRRIGLNSYVFGGLTTRASGGYTGHAWNVITIGGIDYVFDAQVEDNIAKEGPIHYYRFCKTFDEVAKNYIDYDAAASKDDFGGFLYAW